MNDLGRLIDALEIPGSATPPESLLVAARRVTRASRKRRPRWLSGPAAIIGGLVVALSAGYAVAEKIDGGGTSEEVQAVELAEEQEAAIDAMWLDAAERAEAGELKADVNQKQAAETLRSAINPPHDLEAANQLEDDMIALTAKLRASGDIPDIGESLRPGSPESIASSVAEFPGFQMKPVGIDPANCTDAVEAFEDAGLDPPTVYAGACPTAEQTAQDVERFRVLEQRQEALGDGGG